MRRLLAAAAVSLLVSACGGSSGSPPDNPVPAPTTNNPCSTAAIDEEEQAPAHPEADLAGRGSTLAGRNAVDVGEIAVVPDEGDIVLPPNMYDLLNLGLRFTRNSSGGYDVRRFDATFRAGLGTGLTLTDDDSATSTVPFTFQFYGRTQTLAFVNSDGNITFEEPDKSSTERNVARLLTGPPRVSPFLADLDPTAGSGRVFLNAAPDRYTVT